MADAAKEPARWDKARVEARTDATRICHQASMRILCVCVCMWCYEVHCTTWISIRGGDRRGGAVEVRDRAPALFMSVYSEGARVR